MKLYFAHPFCKRVQNRRVQRDVEDGTGISLFNPYYDDAIRKSDTQILDSKNIYDRQSHFDMDSLTDHECQTYIENVIANIKSCDAVLAVPDLGNYSVPFVIMVARGLGVDTYTVTVDFKDCPWFRVYSTAIFHDWAAFKAFFGSY